MWIYIYAVVIKQFVLSSVHHAAGNPSEAIQGGSIILPRERSSSV